MTLAPFLERLMAVDKFIKVGHGYALGQISSRIIIGERKSLKLIRTRVRTNLAVQGRDKG